jgi:hypothetical protein
VAITMMTIIMKAAATATAAVTTTSLTRVLTTHLR